MFQIWVHSCLTSSENPVAIGIRIYLTLYIYVAIHLSVYLTGLPVQLNFLVKSERVHRDMSFTRLELLVTVLVNLTAYGSLRVCAYWQRTRVTAGGTRTARRSWWRRRWRATARRRGATASWRAGSAAPRWRSRAPPQTASARCPRPACCSTPPPPVTAP